MNRISRLAIISGSTYLAALLTVLTLLLSGTFKIVSIEREIANAVLLGYWLSLSACVIGTLLMVWNGNEDNIRKVGVAFSTLGILMIPLMIPTSI